MSQEQQQPAAAPPAKPAAPPAKPAAPTTYWIGLDAGCVERLVAWASTHFDDPDFKRPFPGGLHPTDMVHVGEARGATRAQAVDKLLDQDAPDLSRLAFVKLAEQHEVKLLFLVAPASFLGEVPVQTKIERRRKVGK